MVQSVLTLHCTVIYTDSAGHEKTRICGKCVLYLMCLSGKSAWMWRHPEECLGPSTFAKRRRDIMALKSALRVCLSQRPAAVHHCFVIQCVNSISQR